MNRLIKCLALMLLLSGCQLFRKTTTESKDQETQLRSTNNVTEQKTASWDLEGKTLVIKHDSSNIERRIIINPKGAFKFSADSGFTGEALEIRIDEKRKQMAQLNTNVESKASIRDSSSRESATKEKLINSNKSKRSVSSPANFPILLVAIVLTCATAVAAYRLLKKQ